MHVGAQHTRRRSVKFFFTDQECRTVCSTLKPTSLESASVKVNYWKFSVSYRGESLLTADIFVSEA